MKVVQPSALGGQVEVSEALRPRMVGNEDGTLRLCFDDDRGARAVVWSLGTVSVVTLATGWTLGGPIWSWAGVLSVPVLCGIALAAVTKVGHRQVEVRVSPEAVIVGSQRIAWADLVGVRLDGDVLVLQGPQAIRVPLYGEDNDVQAALCALFARRMKRIEWTGRPSVEAP